MIKKSLLAFAMVMAAADSFAQENGLNPIYTVNVADLQYRVVEKKATVGSVLGTIAEAVAGQASDNSHEEMVPAVNAAVKSAVGKVRRLSIADDSQGGNYEMTGEVTRITTTTNVRTIEEKDSKGKVTKRNVNDYESSVSVSINLTNMSTGEVHTNTFSGSTSFYDYAKTENEALTMAINNMRGKIINYYNTMFPLMANIIERGAEKKDKAKEMYIDLGSANGLYKGQRFTVYVVGKVANRETRSKVGRLKVSEVSGDDISLCKVASGGKDIKKAFDDGKSLLVVSED